MQIINQKIYDNGKKRYRQDYEKYDKTIYKKKTIIKSRN